MKNKHLSFDDRLEIEKGLKENKSFKAIGNIINKDCTTVSKEIKNHIILKKVGTVGRKHFDCKKGKNCPFRQKGTLCNFNNCDYYEKLVCPKLSKPPYVCNGCKEKSTCTLSKQFYESDYAFKEYKENLTNARLGINFSQQELDNLDKILIPLVKEQGQSIHHISPREELIRQTKELRKSVYKIDESMHDKMPKKKESTGLLEDQIEYTKELLKVVKDDGKFTALPGIKEQIDYLEETMNDTEIELEYSKDQDAKVGHKTHIAMTPERIITAATITTGEKHDGKELINLIEKSESNGIEVEAIIGDGAYSEKDNLDYYNENNIKNVSKLSKSVTHGNGKNKDDFEYNKDAGMYVCKAGHMAIAKRKMGSKDKNQQVESYFFDVEKCKHCPFKDGCYKDGTKTFNVKIKNDTHIAQMDYMKTEEFKTLYKERYKIEAKNAELKNNYNYGNANACGKLGITIQGATTLFLTNMKRIIKLNEEKNKNIG